MHVVDLHQLVVLLQNDVFKCLDLKQTSGACVTAASNLTVKALLLIRMMSV